MLDKERLLGVSSGLVRLEGAAGSNILERFGHLLACLFVIELIVAGPGYWLVGGVSLRKVLFSANIIWLTGLWAVGVIRLRAGELLLLIGVILLLLLWVALIPSISSPDRLPLAVLDGLPIATAILWIFFGAFYRDRPRMWRDFCVIIFAALSLIAVVNIGLWILGMSGLLSELAVQGIVLYWFTLGKLDPAPQLYIAMTPEGFFRALWITGTLYVPALLYCVAQRRFWGCVLFAAALIATYTRGLWLGAVIGIAIAQLVSHRMKLFVDGRIAASALVLLLLGALALPLLPQFADQDGVLGLVGYRVSTTFTDSSADERYEQVDPLLYAWQEAPWFGNGFGAQASLLRSEEVSFLYEITALALLMKLGIVGMIAVSVLLGAPWAYSLLRNRPPSRNACASIAGVVAFLVAATTNPYLTNFVGMSAVCFMLLQLHIEHRANVLRR